MHVLCPVRALACNVECTAPFWRTESLFVCYIEGVAGKALSMKRHIISQAYRQVGKDPLTVVRVHSTHGAALFSGVSVEDICMVASWSTPCLFIRFYLLDMMGSF